MFLQHRSDNLCPVIWPFILETQQQNAMMLKPTPKYQLPEILPLLGLDCQIRVHCAGFGNPA